MQTSLLYFGETYYWHVSSINEDTESIFTDFTGFNTGDQTVAINDINEIPDGFRLFPNYPNPFNPSTHISYYLPEASKVALDVYDVLGRHIQSLVNNEQSSGEHTVTFNAGNISSGIYFYRLSAGSFIEIKQMLLIK